MPIPYLTAEQVAQVSELVAQYITTQRTKYASRAIPLSVQQRAEMGGFLSPELLNDVRLVVLDGERVANPEFYPMLRSLGLRISLTNRQWLRSRSRTQWSPMDRSPTGCFFTSMCMWNNIGSSGLTAFPACMFEGF
jgi:hypothetical protein